MKKLLIAIICLLTITSCSSEASPLNNSVSQSFHSEDSYVISFELDENQTGLSREEVYDKIYSAYSNTRLANNVSMSSLSDSFNTNKDYYVVNIYDPYVSSLFKNNGTEFPMLIKEKEEIWNKYTEQIILQLQKIRTLINNNLSRDGWELYVDVQVYHDYDDKTLSISDRRVFLLSASDMEERIERDKNIDPAMNQVIEKVKEYYADTNFITDIYYDAEGDLLVVDIYDPDCFINFFEWGEIGPVFLESKQEDWDEYINEHHEKSSEIYQMLQDCGFEMTEPCMTVYLENMYMIKKGRLTPVIFIMGDIVFLD